MSVCTGRSIFLKKAIFQSGYLRRTVQTRQIRGVGEAVTIVKTFLGFPEG